MIELKKIYIKNFLSVGNKPIEINLNTGKLTLISGKNGSGKSLIIDAITFAIYGTPHRKDINLSDLINRTNKEGLYVSLELSNGDTDYVIKRGIKPAVLEIYKNGSCIEKLSSKIATQNYINDYVIGISKDIFLQICVIGKSNYKPYMSLSLPERRQLIEKIFNLTYFPELLKLVNKSTNKLKNILIELNHSISKADIEISYLEKLEQQENVNNEEQIKELEKQKQELIVSQKDKHIISYDLRNDIRSIINNKQKDLISLSNQLAVCKSKQKNINNSIKRFDTKQGGVCSECGQPISKDLYSKQIEKLENELIELDKSINQIDVDYKDLKEFIDKYNDKLNKELDHIKLLENENREHDNLNIRIKEISNKIKKILSIEKTDKYTKQITELKTNIKNMSDNIDTNNEKMLYLKSLKEFLADDGYKSFLLQNYIPEIQKSINYSLSEYGLPIEVVLEQNFNVTISSYSGKSIKYGTFSEGQKQRINLSIWNSLIDIIRQKINSYINLIFFDEILDGSLDDDGKQIFLDNLKTKINKNNQTCFIISHGMDDFENNIYVELVDGFSTFTVN